MSEWNLFSLVRIFSIGLALLCGATAVAEDLTLAWNPNSESDLGGYKIYFGMASGAYGSPITIGRQTTFTITGLSPGTYYFAVTAYNNAGAESGVSNEVVATIPDTLLACSWDSSAGTEVDDKMRNELGPLALLGEYWISTESVPLITPAAQQSEARSAEAQSSNQTFVGFSFVNLGITPAVLLFTAYDATGTPLADIGMINPVLRTLRPGEQLQILIDTLFGGRVFRTSANCWIKVESTSSEAVGFFMTFDDSLTELDCGGIPESPMNDFLLPAISHRGATQIIIGNPDTNSATLNLDLIGSDGTVQASATRIIPPKGTLIADLSADIFTQTALDSAEYVRAASSVGVSPFELLSNQPGDLAILGGENESSGAYRLYSPQFAVGDIWSTALSIVNLDSTAGNVVIRLFGDDGIQIGDPMVRHVEPFGKVPIVDSELNIADADTISQGYIEIESTGIRLAGSVVFGDRSNGTYAAAMPLVSRFHHSVVYNHLSISAHYFTGISLLNPNQDEAHATIELFNQDGTLARSKDVTLPAGHRLAQLLTQIFPELAGEQRLSGYFRVTSDLGLASYAVFGTNTLTLLSGIPPFIAR